MCTVSTRTCRNTLRGLWDTHRDLVTTNSAYAAAIAGAAAGLVGQVRLDRALLGSRLVESLHKGWNEVLPYARILDPDLKPATTPDEEQARNESLLERLAQLQSEIPEVDKSLQAEVDSLWDEVERLAATVEHSAGKERRAS